jgi:hypothetical protein
MIILNANDHGKAQALTRLITRFPDIIDHGVPLTGTASTPAADQPVYLHAYAGYCTALSNAGSRGRAASALECDSVEKG